MDKNNESEILELNQKSDLMAVICKCPSCGDKYIHGVPYVHVPCRKCGITYRTDFEQDIYTKKARQMLSKISYKNSLIIRSDEKYESSLIHIRQHFIEQHCWDVSGITRTREEYKRCTKCGICLDCYTCKNCGKSFERDKNRRKQRCPHCKSDTFIKTYFKEVMMSEKNQDIKLCPHCKSDRIKMSRTRNKSKCHICSSKKLTETKINIIFEVKIERKKAYRRENV